MARSFDHSYAENPIAGSARTTPRGPDVYPSKDFRIEWGPVFHRGRLDGTARLLVIGQDPAQHETIARRILVGEAGHRLQGFLAKLGIERSYVMVNTYLYSVYGQGGGDKHRDKKIAAYRNRWFKAILAPGKIEAVVALGSLATSAWESWTASPDGLGPSLTFVHITHPTQPEATAGQNAGNNAAAIRRCSRIGTPVSRNCIHCHTLTAALHLSPTAVASKPARRSPYQRRTCQPERPTG